MINLSSWKTWLVLAATLILVTLIMYLIYVADTQASEKVALNKLTPALSAEETEKRCLERLQAEVPALLSQAPIAANTPIIEYNQQKVPVLITPVQYFVLDYTSFLNQVQNHVLKNLPICVQQTGGYTLEKFQIYPLPDSPVLSLSLQYTLLWQKKMVKQSRSVFTLNSNPQSLFQFVQAYVQAQRPLPAIQIKTLEQLSSQQGIHMDLYSLGDAVVYHVCDPVLPQAVLSFAAQYPWEQPVQGAELLNADQIKSSENVQFKEGKFWVIQ